MLALTATHRPIKLETDDVRDMTRNIKVTTIYVSYFLGLCSYYLLLAAVIFLQLQLTILTFRLHMYCSLAPSKMG